MVKSEKYIKKLGEKSVTEANEVGNVIRPAAKSQSHEFSSL